MTADANKDVCGVRCAAEGLGRLHDGYKKGSGLGNCLHSHAVLSATSAISLARCSIYQNHDNGWTDGGYN